MTSASEDHGQGTPDEVIVIIYSTLMIGLIGALVAVALLTKSWMVQAEPSMLQAEPPEVVEPAHH